MKSSAPPREPESAAVRVLHYRAGDSHKFWSIQTRGTLQTVRFGRIGSRGQIATKAFSTDAEAQKAMEKLLAQKRKKGYVEVSAEEAGQAAPKKRVPTGAAPQLVLPFQEGGDFRDDSRSLPPGKVP